MAGQRWRKRTFKELLWGKTLEGELIWTGRIKFGA
jgi:hypothetical protein